METVDPAPPRPPNGESEATVVERRSIVRGELMLALLAAVMALIFFSPARHYLTHFRELNDHIQQAGALAPLLFLLTTAVLVSVGVPRLVFCPLSGMAFGFLPGLLIGQVGTLIGYYGLFLFVRWGGRSFVLRHAQKLPGFTRLVRRPGMVSVIIARQLPVHGMLVNILLGLSPVRHRSFLIGTALGLLPEAIPCTLAGSGAVQPSFGHTAAYIALGASILGALWLGFRAYMRVHPEEEDAGADAQA